ncbi:hypothetical protein EN850_20755 [Mesorhizobium sp. M8A.F.Ca.ET.207.01.1.1]|uniref:hypothetical protein n=1 Tax=Mesorhizobium sp. M8A.F.Ca.ET.207.01.1.1 TaxID=2563968 RepID=UPI00109CB47A|nr:hypothetical protein [Mesorhizobium sp. M8A.F.Ca.ET.207.01.1.1]TGQ79322.1 hypothetical protein EN850_20755 [Mesorhizobium sp. M8A.F.Ca.ET.207.01.1.1]
MQKLGLGRTVVVVVPGYPDAMRIVRQSELVATVPGSCFASASAGDHASTAGLESFELPLPIPRFKISAMWHPRMDADPAHRWLRDTVMSACRAAYARR